MSKRALNTVFACIALLLVCNCTPTPISISTTSPNNTYEVNFNELVGKRELFYIIPSEHKVFLTVKKHKQIIIYNEQIFSGDAYDDRFFDEHPNIKWVSENILWLGYKEAKKESVHDEIRVVNETDRTISHLNVIANDSFFIIELKPKDEVLLISTPQTDKTADYSWVGCFGKFSDNEQSFNGGEGFVIKGKYVSPPQYLIRVKETEVVIESKHFVKS